MNAIFFANSLMARRGLAALHDHRIESPRDVAAATFDDFENLDYVRPETDARGFQAFPDRREGDGNAARPPRRPPERGIRAETLPCALRKLDTA